ncbi:MAG: methylmalonyl-CoA mutase family protein [Vicinamibacterales bacterium]
MRDRFGAKSERSWKLRFHTQTAGVSLTAQQPYNNVVRTPQALSGVLGGTNSLHTNSLDEALALPTEAAATLALRTQQVLAYESGIVDDVDPFGGSHFVEALTKELEDGALAYFEQIDKMGGMVEAIERGFHRKRLPKALSFPAGTGTRRQAHRRRQRAGAVRRIVDPDAVYRRRRVRHAVRCRLEQVRSTRDAAAVRAALERIKAAAAGSDNLMPPILDAVRAYATLGEMCDALRDVWGEYEETAIV